ncbi:MAG TPA: hypothetical protein VFR41_12700 [Acidimicrobiia bacterium]|nr:hypothetical protein [Acidimicrobiia bacterium]
MRPNARRRFDRASLLAMFCALVLAACGGGSKAASNIGANSAPFARVRVVAGDKFSLYLAAADRVLAWGDNVSGELGTASTMHSATPIAVRGLPSDVVAIAAGSNHGLAVTARGTVFAWGHNKSGQLGDGSRTDRTTPAEIAGLQNVRAIAAGFGFSMALEADGTVLAWGNNQSGQLGDGNAPEDHDRPAPVHGLRAGSGVVEIAAGSSFALVRKADGSVWAWGNGTSGQVGDGTKGKQSAPTQVRGLGPGSQVVGISAGGAHALAVKADGSVVAWGHNASGQLGDGTIADRATPVVVRGLDAIVAVSAGFSFSVAVDKNGAVFAWGNNKSGEAGDGTAPKDHHVPVHIATFGGAVRIDAVAAGGSHVVAVAHDGTLWAWGNNSSGQVGNGQAPADAHLPVRVAINGASA